MALRESEAIVLRSYPLREADLLVTSSLPDSLERLGLGWERLHERFPWLCQVAIVGHAPPEENRPGHDLTYQATVGLVAPPTMPLTLLADMAGAQTAVTHSLGVLLERSRTGMGVLSYVPIAEAVDFFTLPLRYQLTIPGGRLGGAFPYYNIYPTADGWLAAQAPTRPLMGLPRDVWIHPFEALAMARTGDVAGAQVLIATTPADCYLCLRVRGEIAAQKGDWLAAESWFAQAIRQAPSLPFAYAGRGQARLARGDPAGAIADFTLAHRASPRFADPLAGWGDALARQGDWKAALAKYDAALKVAPAWAALRQARDAAARRTG